MLRYIIIRILYFIPTLLGISFLIFFLSKNTPGDPVDAFLEEELSINETQASRDALLAKIKKDLGLDKPNFYFSYSKNSKGNYPIIPNLDWHGSNNQYHHWFSNFLKGEYGNSYFDRLPIKQRVWTPLKWTLLLNTISIILAFLISIPLGVYSADQKGKSWEKSSSLFLYFLYSIPSFWLATMLITFLASHENLYWFPSGGLYSYEEGATFWVRFFNIAWHMALPVLSSIYVALSYITKHVQSSMLQVLNQGYIKTAKVKGLSKKQVLWKHGFRNSLFPIITMFSNVLPATIAGTVIIEVIFSFPGIGRLAYDGLLQQDWPLVYTITMLAAVLTLLGNLLSDIIYAYADPRVDLANQKS